MAYKIEKSIPILRFKSCKKRADRHPIIVFDIDGQNPIKYKSIHSFLKAIKKKRKLDANLLAELRERKPIYVYGKIIILQKKYSYLYKINPLLVPKLKKKHAKEEKERGRRLSKGIKGEQNRILVFDTNMQLIESFKGKQKDLAKKYKISEGTLKSMLHRGIGKEQISQTRRTRFNGYYYCYLIDILKSLKGLLTF